MDCNVKCNEEHSVDCNTVASKNSDVSSTKVRCTSCDASSTKTSNVNDDLGYELHKNETINELSQCESSLDSDVDSSSSCSVNDDVDYKLHKNETINELSQCESSLYCGIDSGLSCNVNDDTDYKLGENERIDDLCQDGLKLIQNKDLFCFGVDAVALANVVKANKSDTVLDLCTGNGVIPILLSGKTSCTDFSCVELQQKSYELLCKNIKLNGLQGKIKAYNDDIKTFTLDKEVSVITCNPPYMSNTGAKNLKEELTIARHEVALNLDDIVKCVNRNLKYGGKFYMVHRAERMVDIFAKLRARAIEPKVVYFIKHKNASDKINLIIVEAIKGAKPSLKLQDLYLT